MPYTILVTGANKGIGYEAVKLLSQKKPEATVLLGSRSLKNGEDAIAKMKSSDPSNSYDNIKVVELDITSHSSLKAAAEHIKSTYSTLDALLHNSGISNLNGDPKHPEIFNVNIRGAKDSVETFLPLIPKNGVIGIVSSEVGSWYNAALPEVTRAKLDDIDSVTWDKVEYWMNDWEAFAADKQAKEAWVPLSEGMQAGMYCASKGILNPWIRKFAADHPEVRVASVCPGYCATDLNGNSGFRSAAQGGESVIFPFFNEFTSGRFYQDGEQKPFSFAMPKEFASASLE